MLAEGITDPMLPPGTNLVGMLMVFRSALPFLTEFTQRTTRRTISRLSQRIWASRGQHMSSMGTHSPATRETCSGTRRLRRTRNPSAAMNQHVSSTINAVGGVFMNKLSINRSNPAGLSSRSVVKKSTLSMTCFRTYFHENLHSRMAKPLCTRRGSRSYPFTYPI